jgi:hypothetical protein
MEQYGTGLLKGSVAPGFPTCNVSDCSIGMLKKCFKSFEGTVA